MRKQQSLNEHKIALDIRYCEVDRMDVVHHSRYWPWFELLRVEWLKKLNLNYKELEDRGLYLPLVSASIEYKHPLHFGDRVLIHGKLKKCRASMISFLYQVQNQASKTVALASSDHVCLGKNRRAVKLPPELRGLV